MHRSQALATLLIVLATTLGGPLGRHSQAGDSEEGSGTDSV